MGFDYKRVESRGYYHFNQKTVITQNSVGVISPLLQIKFKKLPISTDLT